MVTVAFMVDAIASHLYSSIGLARRLQRRGFDVEYWGSARNGSDTLIKSQGFRFSALNGVLPRYDDETRFPTDLNALNVWFRSAEWLPKIAARRRRWKTVGDSLDQIERSLDRRLSESRPAFVVMDPFLLAYYPLMYGRDVPTVVLSTKPLPIKDPAVPPYDSSLMPRRSAASRIRIEASWRVRELRDLNYRAVRAAARLAHVHTYGDLLLEAARRTGFPLADELVRRSLQPDLHFKSIQEWALWTPDTDLPRDRALPPNVHYVGPSVDVVRRQTTVPFAPSHKCLVYVAVGTVRARWRDNLSFLRKVISAFAGVPDVFVVISSGHELATKVLGATPQNVQIFDFLPQLTILDSANLVITHAGAGTYRECIEKGVPMLAYPRNHDQKGNATRIAYHGLGLRGDRNRDSVVTIRDKALAVLGDGRYVNNLRKLRTAVHATEERLLNEALASIGVQTHPIEQLTRGAA